MPTQRLDLRQRCLELSDIESLSLLEAPIILELDLSENNFSLEMLKALGLVLKDSGVKTLYLGAIASKECLGEEEIEAICTLITSSQINSLDLRNNRLNERSFIKLLEMLPKTQLSSLSLAALNLSFEQIKALLQIIPDTFIKNLDLSANYLTILDLWNLNKTLRASKLEHLKLRDTGLGFFESVFLEKLLQDTNLKELDLGFPLCKKMLAILSSNSMCSRDTEKKLRLTRYEQNTILNRLRNYFPILYPGAKIKILQDLADFGFQWKQVSPNFKKDIKDFFKDKKEISNIASFELIQGLKSLLRIGFSSEDLDENLKKHIIYLVSKKIENAQTIESCIIFSKIGLKWDDFNIVFKSALVEHLERSMVWLTATEILDIFEAMNNMGHDLGLHKTSLRDALLAEFSEKITKLEFQEMEDSLERLTVCDVDWDYLPDPLKLILTENIMGVEEKYFIKKRTEHSFVVGKKTELDLLLFNRYKIEDGRESFDESIIKLEKSSVGSVEPKATGSIKFTRSRSFSL
jgi:hypothetical protein